jgi:transmembrane sensor
VTKNEPNNNDELIIKFLAGEASPEEALALMQWLEEGDNKKWFEETRTVFQFTQAEDPLQGINKAMAWENIKNRTTLEAPKRVWYFRRLVPTMAALLIILILGGVSIYFFGFEQEEHVIRFEAQQSVEQLQLPDGSNLSMLGLSSVVYGENFGVEHRSLTLEKGEMYFEVVSQPGLAFVIKTALGEIEVLGTSFNVTLENDRLEVAVEKGNVQLTSNKNETLVIGAGQTGQLLEDKLSLKNHINENLFAYATGRLRFEETSIREVLHILEKTYGLTIGVRQENILNCHLTGTFNGISMENLVNLIAETLNLSVVKNEQGYILEGKGC